MHRIRHPFTLLVALILFAILATSVNVILGQTISGPSFDWTQDARDPQRTGYTTEEPVLPWRFLWSWNGPDASGGTGGHFYDAPPEARTITGGPYVYVPAGSRGIYALNKLNGQQAWNLTVAAFNATPAYDATGGFLIAGAANGQLYKIDLRTGTVSATYNAGNPLNKSVLLIGSFAFVVTDNGQLHKVNISNMTRVWMYTANAAIATPPSYSQSRDAIIYATNDLFVDAVNNTTGTVRWRVKPTPNTAGFQRNGWHVARHCRTARYCFCTHASGA